MSRMDQVKGQGEPGNSIREGHADREDAALRVALDHPVRREILRVLRDGATPMPARAINSGLSQQPWPPVSYHLPILKAVQLIVEEPGLQALAPPFTRCITTQLPPDICARALMLRSRRAANPRNVLSRFTEYPSDVERAL